MSHSTFDMFLNLIPALQVEMLVHWLTMKDVGMLDSALCSKMYRESFLKILGDDHCIFEHTPELFYGGHIEWIIEKKLKVSNAKLPYYFDRDFQSQFLQTTGKSLRKLFVPDVKYLRQESLTNNIVSELSSWCTNLEELVFTDCNLSNTDVCSVLQHLPRLRHLDLHKCRNLTGAMVVNINQNAKQLETIIFSDCSIVDDIPPNTLVRHHKIHTIEVINLGRVDKLVPFLLQCSSLRVLHVDNIHLADLLLILTERTTIRSLFASLKTSPHLTQSEFETLIGHMKHLKILQLYLPQWEGTWGPLFDKQLLHVVHHCPQLRMLLASHIPHRYVHSEYGFGLTESIPNTQSADKIHGAQSQLQTLVVSTIAVNTLQSLLLCCPQLTTFKIKLPGGSGEPVQWPEIMTAISKSNIKSLDLGFCDDLQGKDVLLLQNMSSLSLTFADLKHTAVVKLIGRNLHLRKLNLVYCCNLTHRTLMYIVDKCKDLEELRFNNLDGNDLYDDCIDSKVVVAFVKSQRPKLKKLTVQLPN